MHIKHYHPEILKKSSTSAPNVADLAYARTVGDHLDQTASPPLPPPPAEKVVKQETSSKKVVRSLVSGGKTCEKKTLGLVKGTLTAKEAKKKDVKAEPETVSKKLTIICLFCFLQGMRMELA